MWVFPRRAGQSFPPRSPGRKQGRLAASVDAARVSGRQRPHANAVILRGRKHENTWSKEGTRVVSSTEVGWSIVRFDLQSKLRTTTGRVNPHLTWRGDNDRTHDEQVPRPSLTKRCFVVLSYRARCRWRSCVLCWASFCKLFYIHHLQV